jgi:6-pyruvoyltetrahydropterin/6-carboxytetrahydropterin synthase
MLISMDASELVVASRRFEAARRIESLPDTDRRSALHGHGFIASVHANIPSGWAAFDGGECHDLQEHLARCVGPLDYNLLNELVDSPTDENVAAWIGQRVDVPSLKRIAIQSTQNQGASIAPGGPNVHIWRRYTLHAAHRLPYVPVGHKCGRLHGHGFAIVVHSTRALTDQSFGYDELDLLWAPLHTELSHRCLNDILGLENPTSEMLSSWVWERLKPSCPSLSAITVFETGSCGATYDGTRYRIWKDFTLDSAVRMGSAPAADPRHRVHGHTYTLRLKLTAPLDAVMGWTIDFGDVKTIFEPVLKSLDHHPLHEQPELANGDAASIARWVRQRVLADLPQLSSVELYETEGCGVVVGDSEGDPGLPV